MCQNRKSSAACNQTCSCVNLRENAQFPLISWRKINKKMCEMQESELKTSSYLMIFDVFTQTIMQDTAPLCNILHY